MDPNASKKGMFNKLNKQVALQNLEAETFNRKTVSFYKYVILHNAHQLRDELYEQWNVLDVLGRIYLAEEGVNAQLSVPEHNWDAFVFHVNSYTFFHYLNSILVIFFIFWK